MASSWRTSAGLTATDTEQFQIGNQTANIVTAGTYSDSQLSLENNVFLRDADMQSFGFNVDYTFDNAWVAKFDVSHSSIDRSDTAEFESNSAPGGAGSLNDTVTFRDRLLRHPIWRWPRLQQPGLLDG